MNVEHHLASSRVGTRSSDGSKITEVELIVNRAGTFPTTDEMTGMTICPKHRNITRSTVLAVKAARAVILPTVDLKAELYHVASTLQCRKLHGAVVPIGSGRFSVTAFRSVWRITMHRSVGRMQIRVQRMYHALLSYGCSTCSYACAAFYDWCTLVAPSAGWTVSSFSDHKCK